MSYSKPILPPPPPPAAPVQPQLPKKGISYAAAAGTITPPTTPVQALSPASVLSPSPTKACGATAWSTPAAGYLPISPAPSSTTSSPPPNLVGPRPYSDFSAFIDKGREYKTRYAKLKTEFGSLTMLRGWFSLQTKSLDVILQLLEELNLDEIRYEHFLIMLRTQYTAECKALVSSSSPLHFQESIPKDGLGSFYFKVGNLVSEHFSWILTIITKLESFACLKSSADFLSGLFPVLPNLNAHYSLLQDLAHTMSREKLSVYKVGSGVLLPALAEDSDLLIYETTSVNKYSIWEKLNTFFARNGWQCRPPAISETAITLTYQKTDSSDIDVVIKFVPADESAAITESLESRVVNFASVIQDIQTGFARILPQDARTISDKQMCLKTPAAISDKSCWKFLSKTLYKAHKAALKMDENLVSYETDLKTNESTSLYHMIDILNSTTNQERFLYFAKLFLTILKHHVPPTFKFPPTTYAQESHLDIALNHLFKLLRCRNSHQAGWVLLCIHLIFIDSESEVKKIILCPKLGLLEWQQRLCLNTWNQWHCFKIHEPNQTLLLDCQAVYFSFYRS